MDLHVSRHLVGGLLLLFPAIIFSGCKNCARSEPDLPPWRFESEAGEYAISFPGQWRREPAGSINPYAELAASRDGILYFMVIPQQLPTFPKPDMSELRATALKRLEETVDDFRIDRQGTIDLDGVEATTIFASGRLGERSISYINTYLIESDFGYQIVAFTESEHKEVLFQEMDLILSTWVIQRPLDRTSSNPTQTDFD